jgi:hypothetical protein
MYAPLLQVEYTQAYMAAEMNNEPFYVVAHSGGASAGGVATGIFNLMHGYGTVTRQYNINGFDAFGIGTAAAEYTGTQVESYYTATDVVSWGGAGMDFMNPFTVATDPGKNLQALDPFRWGMGNFEDETVGGHVGGSNSAFGNWMDFDNVFGGKTVGSKMLKGTAIYGLATGDWSASATLLGQHYGNKILRTATWLANPLNLIGRIRNRIRGDEG